MNSHAADSGITSATVVNDSISHEIHQSGTLYRQRSRGSLPLKKRRLLLEFGLKKNDYDRESVTSATISSSCDQIQSMAIPAGSDEKIAALALVAAATAALEPALTTSFTSPQIFTSKNGADGTSICSEVTQCPENTTTSQHPPFISQHLPVQQKSPQSRPQPQPQPQPQPHAQSQPQQQELQQAHPVKLNSQPQFSDESSKTSRQRIHHPPLSQPLPNGCHGRTSRNNSYCRRHPCYNGSKYCKLHYQQYVIAGTRVPSDGTGSDASSDNGSLATVNKPSGVQSGISALPQQHQDKRYTGFGDECRCQATTTRGRPCAYVSVNKTKYCHLHVDYDVNPPPRRGGISSATASPNVQKKVRHKLSTDEEQSVASSTSRDAGTDVSSDSGAATAAKTTTLAAPLSTSSEDASSLSVFGHLKSVLPNTGTTVTGSSSKESALNSTFSSYPLLSSISSDQWFNKLVTVSTGPLVNRTGRVVKWGNGWVTVRISTGNTTHDGSAGLLHNRRSIELFLLPDKQDQQAGEEKPKPEVNEGGDENTSLVAISAGSSQLEVPVADSADASQSHDLRRCVSRDNDSPDPSSAEDDPFETASNVDTSAICKIDSKEPTKNREQEAPLLEDKPPQSEAPTVLSPVPKSSAGEDAFTLAKTKSETPPVLSPVPESSSGEDLSSVSKTDAKRVIESSLETAPETPRPDTAFGEGVTRVTPKPLTPKTPNETTETGKSVPLLQELLAAQTGANGRKYNLDLVFNTPSRVTRKPTLYQDTAMLEKKRSCSSSSESEANINLAQKRKRSDPNSP